MSRRDGYIVALAVALAAVAMGCQSGSVSHSDSDELTAIKENQRATFRAGFLSGTAWELLHEPHVPACAIDAKNGMDPLRCEEAMIALAEAARLNSGSRK